jgi:hypothetical protein
VTHPSVPSISTRTARILHGALGVGALALAVVLSVLRTAAPGAGVPLMLLRLVALGVCLVDLLVARGLRGRIPPLAAGEDEDAWWRGHLPKAIVTWAVVESAVLFGAVVHFVTGDWVPLAVAAAALAVLWAYRPARLLAG